MRNVLVELISPIQASSPTLKLIPAPFDEAETIVAVKLPPALILPATPMPPDRTTPPVLVLVDVVALVNVVAPLELSVVNAPVDGVALPTGAPFNDPMVNATPVILPPVICALLVVILVNVATFGLVLPITALLRYNPLMAPIPSTVNPDTVDAAIVTPVKLPPVIFALVELRIKAVNVLRTDKFETVADEPKLDVVVTANEFNVAAPELDNVVAANAPDTVAFKLPFTVRSPVTLALPITFNVSLTFVLPEKLSISMLPAVVDIVLLVNL